MKHLPLIKKVKIRLIGVMLFAVIRIVKGDPSIEEVLRNAEVKIGEGVLYVNDEP